MKNIHVKTLRQVMINVADEIIMNEPYLTQVDMVIGDGDHGTGMKRGFTAVKKMLLESPEFETVSALFKSIGTELVKTMGGASGVIFGTMFIGGLSKLGQTDVATFEELALFFAEGEAAIERRGKAKAGQKTMLDALIPAVESLLRSAKNNENIEIAFGKAYEEALKGVEASKAMKSKVGRSKNFQDATIGIPDPGAISTSLIFKAMYEGLVNSKQI